MRAASAAIGLGLALAPAIALAPAAPARAQLPGAIARALEGATWPRAPLLDRAREATGATIAWERHDTQGEGATVCVIDTGVDLHHRDLRDAAGRTRVAWLVDLEGEPRGPTELERAHDAAIWSADDIDAALAAGDPTLPGDRHGHGTAIASIAAGDDADGETPGPAAGIAPRAQLIVVRALRTGAVGFEDRDVIAGAELCFALAGDPSRTVALVALGNHDGAHDGSSALERALGAIAERGHAIVVAAGNDGERAIHAGGRGLPGAPARVVLRVPGSRGVDEPFVALAVRGAGALAIATPRGDRLHDEAGRLAMLDHEGGFLAIDRREAGVTHVVIGGRGALAAGAYEISIESGAFDAWIVDAHLGAVLFAPGLEGPHASSAETITIPATAPALLAVSALRTRDALAMLEAEARDDGSLALSSTGPGPAGDPRPDLAAPGGLLSAALSGDLVPDDETNLVGGSRAVLDRARLGDDRIAIAGSSAAAAIVAGAHALAYALARADPTRDRALLRATADGEEAWTGALGAGGVRIDRWLDARAAADTAGEIDPIASALSLTRDVVVPGATRTVAIARVIDHDGRPVHGGVLAIRAGSAALSAPIRHGIAEVPIELALAAGDRVTIEAAPLAPRTLEARVDEGRDWSVGGGGCAIARGAPWRTFALMLLVALVAARRRARRRS